MNTKPSIYQPLGVTIWNDVLGGNGGPAADLAVPMPPISFCSWGCRCEELFAAELGGLTNLPLAGVAIEPLEIEPLNRLEEAVKRGRTVVVFGPSAATRILGRVSPGVVMARRYLWTGRIADDSTGLERYQGQRAYVVRPTRAIVRPRGVKKWTAILNACILGNRPTALGLCPGLCEPTVRGWGCSGFEAFSQARSVTPSFRSLVVSTRRITAAFRQTARTLGALNWGSSKNENAFLRGALEIAETGAEALRDVSWLIDRLNPEFANDIGLWSDLGHRLFTVGFAAQTVSHDVFEAAASVPAIRETSAFSISGPQPEGALDELVYLARGGSARFRQRAAQGLAGSKGRRYAATLGQLLFDEDAVVSDCALEALKTFDPGEAIGILINALSNVPVRRVGASVSLRPGILEALSARQPSETTLSLLSDFLMAPPAEDTESSRITAAWLLRRDLREDCHAVFKEALEFGPTPAKRLARKHLNRDLESG